VVIQGVALCLAGIVLLRFGVREASRAALFSSTFWITFREFASYRRRRLWPVALGLGGAILLIWGLVVLFQWLLGYYAARLGHPLGAG
jgi:hypothetical protein